MRWVGHKRKGKLSLKAFSNDIGEWFSDEAKKAIYDFLINVEGDVGEELITSPDLVNNSFEYYETEGAMVEDYPGLGKLRDVSEAYTVIPLSEGFILCI